VRISLAAVTYRSSGVLAGCIESFRREAGRMGAEPEVVVVDHSQDDRELAVLDAMAVDRLLPRPNRGFAAGVNLAVANSSGELVLIANPDIELLPGSLEGLVAALRAGFTVVGPQLVWDREGTIHLPVPDDPSPRAELRRAMCRRRQAAWERHLDRTLDTLHRLWSASGPVEVPALRGPALLVSRESFLQLGPWNEGYFLYYEETEWLHQARRRGALLAMAGGARVHHRWGHATRHLDAPAELEGRSRRRFIRRSYAPWWRWLLGSSGAEDGVGVRAAEVGGLGEVGSLEADLWVLSPWSHLAPAAGWLGPAGVPASLAGLTAAGRWYLAAARRGGAGWKITDAWTWGGA